MAIRFSSSLLASLCYEQTHGVGDQEGFLLGKIISHVTDVISDSQLNTKKEENSLYVYNYIPCHGLFSWYDSGGHVHMDSLRQLLQGNQHHKEVIGWYKIRRHSTLSVSLRERMVHKHLLEAFPGVLQKHFLFCLFTCSATSNMATHSFDHALHCLDNKQFKRLPIQVTNLEDTSHSDYKHQPCYSTQGIFHHTIASQVSDFMEPNNQLTEVINMRTLQSQVQMKLTELSERVGKSEERLGELRSEVAKLRDIHRRKNPLRPIDVTEIERKQKQAEQRHSKPLLLPDYIKPIPSPTLTMTTQPRPSHDLHEDLMLLAQNDVMSMKSVSKTLPSLNAEPFGLDAEDSEDEEDLYSAVPRDLELHTRMAPDKRREKNERSTNMAAAGSRQYSTLGRTREPAGRPADIQTGSTMSLDRHRKLVPASELDLSLNVGKKTELTRKDNAASSCDSENNSTAGKQSWDHFDFVSDLIIKAKSPTSPTRSLAQAEPVVRNKPPSKATTSRNVRTKVSGDAATRTKATTATTRVHGTKASALHSEVTSSRATRSKSHEKERAQKPPTESVDVELSHSPTF